MGYGERYRFVAEEVGGFGKYTSGSIENSSPEHNTPTSAPDVDPTLPPDPTAPAVMTGLSSPAQAQMKGSGLIVPNELVMWAHVSAEVDRRLAENIEAGARLKPDEWKSGDMLRLVEAVGDRLVIEAM